MKLKIDGKTIDVAASRLDDIRAAYIRAAYSDAEHIPLTEPQIRVVFRKSDAAEPPKQTTEQE